MTKEEFRAHIRAMDGMSYEIFEGHGLLDIWHGRKVFSMRRSREFRQRSLLANDPTRDNITT
jgi:hypothetical protein